MLIKGIAKDYNEILYARAIEWTGAYYIITWVSGVFDAKDFKDDEVPKYHDITKESIDLTINNKPIIVEDIEYINEYNAYIVHKERGKVYYYTNIRNMNIYRWSVHKYAVSKNNISDAKSILMRVYGDKSIMHIAKATAGDNLFPGLGDDTLLNIANNTFIEIEKIDGK